MDQQVTTLRRRSRTCWATARCRPTRSGGSCWSVRASHAGPGRAVRPGLHRAAAARALAGRRRGPRARAASTCRRRTWPRSACAEADLDAPTASPACARWCAFETDARRALLDAGAAAGRRACTAGPGSPSPATSPAGGPRSTRCGGRRRRAAPVRPGRADARRRGTPLRRRHGGGPPMTDDRWTERLRASLRGDHPRRRRATSTTASGCCPRRSASALCARLRAGPADRRHRRRRPAAPARSRPRWPSLRGASPTSTDAGPGRPGAGRGRRRGPALPVPLGAFDELIDGVEMDVRRPPLRRPSTTWSLLPLRRRLGRPAVPGRLRQPPATRTAARYADAARHRAAADEHPARHPRGPAQRPGLPAAGGPRPLRRRAAARRGRPAGRRRRRAGRADPVRRRAGRGLVRRRAAPGPAARPAQRGLLHRPCPGIYRRLLTGSPPTRRWSSTSGCRCPGWQKAGVAVRALRGPAAMSDRVGGRRRRPRRHHRRAALRRRRARGHPARGPAAARRADLLVPARRARRRQRPARVPALLHGVPGAARPARRAATR